MADRSVSAPVEVYWQAILGTSLAVERFSFTLEERKRQCAEEGQPFDTATIIRSGTPTICTTVVLMESQSIPVLQCNANPVDDTDNDADGTFRVGVECLADLDPPNQGRSLNALGIRAYITNESDEELSFRRGKVHIAVKTRNGTHYRYPSKEGWELDKLKIPPGSKSKSLMFGQGPLGRENRPNLNFEQFKITFKLTVGIRKKYSSPGVMVANSLSHKSASDLSEAIRVFQEKGADSADISLMCEGKTFPAHKAILAARSDVFAAMFQHSTTREAVANEVHIEDFDSATVERFLRYIYGGFNMDLADLDRSRILSSGGDLRDLADVFDLTFQDADCLMMMSDKYNVKGLMDISRYILIKEMTVDNLYRAAILGDMCNDDVLKDAAMQKLIRSGKNIKGIEGWEALNEFPALSLEIAEFFSQSVKPDSCTPPPPKRRKTSL